MCLIGFSINISNASSGAKYFGTFLIVAGSYAGFPGVVAWYVQTEIGLSTLQLMLWHEGSATIYLVSINEELEWLFTLVLETLVEQ